MKKILTLLLITGSVVLAGCSHAGKDVQAKTDFAQCITDTGMKMYGASWCKHCKEQKDMFGLESFESVDYVECTKQQTTCDLAGVTSYPTWIGSGYKQSGVHSFEQLSKVTGCELPSVE